jgi:hypothetical protein
MADAVVDNARAAKKYLHMMTGNWLVNLVREKSNHNERGRRST